MVENPFQGRMSYPKGKLECHHRERRISKCLARKKKNKPDTVVFARHISRMMTSHIALQRANDNDRHLRNTDVPVAVTFTNFFRPMLTQ